MASKSTKGEILAKFFDDGEYTALFADGAVSAASGYAAGQQAYAVFQNGEAVSVKDVEKNIKVLELAAQTGCPVVTFYDSVGAKLAEGLDVLNAAAKLNATIAKVSGVVPQVAVVLGVCGGYQMLGQYYKTWDGVQLDFIGAINVHTIGAKERMIGNYMYRTTPESSGSIVVGFENHSGKTYLGEDVAPLGMMIKGYGNNGEDQTEGARYNNVFATYSHGSLLPKNPVLCDFILQTALDRRYGKTEPLVPLNDTLELNAHNYMEQRLSK